MTTAQVLCCVRWACVSLQGKTKPVRVPGTSLILPFLAVSRCFMGAKWILIDQNPFWSISQLKKCIFLICIYKPDTWSAYCMLAKCTSAQQSASTYQVDNNLLGTSSHVQTKLQHSWDLTGHGGGRGGKRLYLVLNSQLTYSKFF